MKFVGRILSETCLVVALTALLGNPVHLAPANRIHRNSQVDGQSRNRHHQRRIAHRIRNGNHNRQYDMSRLERIPSLPCIPGQFLKTLTNGSVECTPCSGCPAGYGVHLVCTGRSDTECEACDMKDSYLMPYFGIKKCFKCRTCDNSEVKSECTPTTNRVCGGCKIGYFRDDITERCIACSNCYPELPGYGIVEPLCIHKDQPPSMTCLPSLQPVQLRTTTPASRSTKSRNLQNRVQNLDDKLRALGKIVSNQLWEVRQELDQLSTEVKQVPT